MSRTGREILLGVGGGIAAYKSADLIRRLQDHGYLVTVVPTPSSLNFVGTATWEALTGRPVHSQVWENVHEVPHISLAEVSDCILIAPATADLIARIAQGRADDLLTNIVLASTAPKMIVPAMHPAMWNDAGTVANVSILRERGFLVMDPDVGRLTGGDVGAGRFPESLAIIETMNGFLSHISDLIGKEILITAGGTREPIDPVRFIGNRSSGKQGYAVAQAALSRGAKVRLISANCDLPVPQGAEIVRVETADEMNSSLNEYFAYSDVLVMCAAVADAKPTTLSNEKIKKSDLTTLSFVANPDLLASISQKRRSGQIVVGFAAETSNMEVHAREKLKSKGLDIIFVNDVSGGAIFGSDETRGTMLFANAPDLDIPSTSKDTLAHELLNQVVNRLS